MWLIDYLVDTFRVQSFDTPDLAVIGLLVILEGVLSIDNALVLGLLAKRLPKHQQRRALAWGLWGAFIFRTFAVLTASYLLQWTIVKFIGGAYLVYIAVKHLFFEAQEEEADKIVLDEAGNLVIVDAETGGPLTREQEDLEIKERVPFDGITNMEGDAPKEQPTATAPAQPEQPKMFANRADLWRFWRTVAVIELTDIAFAVDSILAAIALAGGRQQKLWVIITGGILGMILMRFAAAIFIRLLDRFPRFELSAYLLVIVIGLKLLVDWGFNSDWSFRQQPWIANRLGSWKQTFEDIEERRLNLVRAYDDWIDRNWIFKVRHEPDAAAHKPPEPQPNGQGEIAAPHVPHLLDFHDLRFPECMAFWLLMAICFLVGFIPQKQPDAKTGAKPASS